MTFQTLSSRGYALIAATALVHGATVVTRNVQHFETSCAKLLNPWEVTAGV